MAICTDMATGAQILGKQLRGDPEFNRFQQRDGRR